MTDQDVIVGLGRAMLFLVSELLLQGALDREKTIKQFREISKQEGEEPHEIATKFFVDQMIVVMESDPSRPPPAPVIQFPRGT